MSPAPKREEVLSALAAAKKELQERQSRVQSAYQQRITRVDEITEAFQAGQIKPSAVPRRIEELLAEDAGGAGRTTGRRSRIGMTSPALGGAGAPVIKGGPSKAMVGAALSKTLATLNHRIVTLLSTSQSDTEKAVGKIELSFLTGHRQALLLSLDDLPSDAVLLEAMVAYCEAIHAEITEVSETGLPRIQMLTSHLKRVISAELIVTSSPELKELRESARVLLLDSRVPDAPIAPLEQRLVGIWNSPDPSTWRDRSVSPQSPLG